MGSSNSHLKIKKQSKIPNFMKKERNRMSEESMISSENIYEIDNKPIRLNDELHINLNPQGIILVFTITEMEGCNRYEFYKAIFRNRYDPIVEVMSEQILIPISLMCNIPIHDSILHMYRDNTCHLRILERQLGKIWFLEDSNLNVIGYANSLLHWVFWITDNNHWLVNYI
jgi:hypothetical protein